MAQVVAEKNEANFTVPNNLLAIGLPISTEELAFAYGSLILMALFPIIVGAFRSLSVSHLLKQKVISFPFIGLVCMIPHFYNLIYFSQVSGIYYYSQVFFSFLLSDQQEIKVINKIYSSVNHVLLHDPT